MNRRIKIVYLIGSLGCGGAENQLIELLSRLDRKRFEAFLVLLHSEGVERAHGLVREVHELRYFNGLAPNPRRSVLRSTQALWHLRKLLKRLRPDIFHAILPTACVLGSVAAKWCRVPITICGRRSLVDCYRKGSRFLAWADKWASRQADVVIANSLAVRRELIEADHISTSRVRIIYNGVDLSSFAPRNNGRNPTYVPKNKERVLVGTVANFISYKRHCDVVEAAGRLCGRHPELHFVFVGEDRGTLPMVQEEIARKGLSERFTIIPGSYEIPKIFQSLDIYVCPSETEGFSNVVLEAMAAGKPVVATCVGGNPEAVVHGETGFLVPPHCPEALASAIENLLERPQLRKQMGARASERAALKFSVDAMVQHYDKLYLELAREERVR